MNFVKLAEFANAFDVAEEINDEEFIGSESGKDGSPNQRRVLAADGFAVLGFEQLQPDGLDIGTEVEGFHVEGKRRQLQGAGIEQRFAGGAHISDSVRGNFARKSDACLRTSSQSKKASGVSSQMRNQLAISTFSARLLGSTLGLREIISARRFPRRATFKTRSTAARSPWDWNLRMSSSRRMMLSSASSSVLKCSKSSNSSSYCSSASSCCDSTTRRPALFKTSAI